MSEPAARALRTCPFYVPCCIIDGEWEQEIIAIETRADGLGWNLVTHDGSDGGVACSILVRPETSEDRAYWESVLYAPA